MMSFKKITNFLLFSLMIINLSCKKNKQDFVDNNPKNKEDTSPCNCYLDTTIIPSGNILLQDSLKSYYFNAWKSILKQKSNMSDVYFDKHVQNIVISPSSWDAGISYRVDYFMCYDWLKVRCFDEFLIMLDSNYQIARSPNWIGHGMPRNQFLSKSVIQNNLNKDILSEISTYQLIETLPYRSLNSLCAAIRRDMSLTTFNIDRISYFVPGKLPREDGYLYAIIEGPISGSTLENCKWLSGYYNLSDGTKHQVRIEDCSIK